MRGYEPPASPLDAPAPITPAVPAKNNGFAVVALSMGIIWYFWIGSILALIFGYIAKRQIDASQGQQKGRGFAVAGIVLGWVGVGILALVIFLMIVKASSSGSQRPRRLSGRLLLEAHRFFALRPTKTYITYMPMFDGI